MTWVTPSPLSTTMPVSVRSSIARDFHDAARANTACTAMYNPGTLNDSNIISANNPIQNRIYVLQNYYFDSQGTLGEFNFHQFPNLRCILDFLEYSAGVQSVGSNGLRVLRASTWKYIALKIVPSDPNLRLSHAWLDTIDILHVKQREQISDSGTRRPIHTLTE